MLSYTNPTFFKILHSAQANLTVSPDLNHHSIINVCIFHVLCEYIVCFMKSKYDYLPLYVDISCMYSIELKWPCSCLLSKNCNDC